MPVELFQMRAPCCSGVSYSAGAFIAKFCYFPGTLIGVGVVIPHWVVIWSFTVIKRWFWQRQQQWKCCLCKIKFSIKNTIQPKPFPFSFFYRYIGWYLIKARLQKSHVTSRSRSTLHYLALPNSSWVHTVDFYL